MEFHDIIQRAMDIRRQYADWERQQHGRSWTDEEIALGFVGDVGDLMKLIQAQNGIRSIPDVDAKLAHELADCLWSVIVLSQTYGIDLENEFLRVMDDLESTLQQSSRN